MGFNKLNKDIAQALVEETMEQGTVPEMIEQAGQLAEVFAVEPALLADLSDTAVTLEKRQEILRVALKGLDKNLVNTLLLLQEKEILRDYRQFYASLLEIAERTANHREVQVTSPIPLDEDEKDELKKALRKKFGGTQRLHEMVDPSILGGLVVRVGDWTFDASLKGKITRLKQALYV